LARQVLPISELSNDARLVYKAVNQERSDLACALILTAYLEQCLGTLIASRLIKSALPEKLLNPSRGILGTFQSRIDLSYCLGLITKGIHQNLCSIAAIRNTFAHSHLDLRFEDPRIQRLSEELTLPSFKTASDSPDASEKLNARLADFISTPRMRFTFVTVIMANRLMLTSLSTRHLPKKTRGWEEELSAA